MLADYGLGTMPSPECLVPGRSHLLLGVELAFPPAKIIASPMTDFHTNGKCGNHSTAHEKKQEEKTNCRAFHVYFCLGS